jgi:hypothetical protein
VPHRGEQCRAQPVRLLERSYALGLGAQVALHERRFDLRDERSQDAPV